MDLKGNRITMGEILKNGAAKALLLRAFPELDNPLMLMMAKGMTLDAVLKLGAGRYDPEKIARVLAELAAL